MARPTLFLLIALAISRREQRLKQWSGFSIFDRLGCLTWAPPTYRAAQEVCGKANIPWTMAELRLIDLKMFFGASRHRHHESTVRFGSRLRAVVDHLVDDCAL